MRIGFKNGRAWLLPLTSVLVAGVMISGCAQGSIEPVAISPSAAPVPKGLEDFYLQKVSWQTCEDDKDYQCATVQAPLDYDDPAGRRIDLALKKLPASSGKPIGSLLVNPGGPGGSGVEYISEKEAFTKNLRRSYDIIGFDPRGVGKSTPLTCLSPRKITEVTEAVKKGENPQGAEGSAESEEDSAQGAAASAGELVTACEQNSAQGLLDHMGTASVAKDMDMLRALAGDSKLHYFGASYGTYLGARYAEIFPGNVGRMVLDSAQDPSLQHAQLSIDQAAALERALGAYIESCQAGFGCPLTGDFEEGRAKLKELIDRADAEPIPVGESGEVLSGQDMVTGIGNLLYDDRAWPELNEALSKAMTDNDATALNDLINPKDPDESPEEAARKLANQAAERAVDCQDYPVKGDHATWEAEAARIKEIAPIMGAGLAYQDAFCQGWGHHSGHEPAELSLTGTAPILVLGVTGDPATPYEWAQRLASQLESGRLVTVTGNGHGAYQRLGDCVNDTVDTYLLRGELPGEDLTCEGELQK
ncbi:alpha/beta hydrolase [Propionibacterium australiense]|nr:alpha/beta hydrolase [Propionibacterium australiense]SYZ32905.1 Peptidase S33 tripeptidyl aminopeptidase-like, C-terminal [Propionibacterium australiense]VEH92459.1 Tripeptidyl aminopeptidase precursor [Propionibacterium australiense]